MEIQYKFLITAAVLIIGYVLIKFTFALKMSKKLSDFRNDILNNKEPSTLKRALNYEMAISSLKERFLMSKAVFLLFQYYRKNSDFLLKAIKYGEQIKDNYKDEEFYENAIFMLGNLYFFDTNEFNKAVDIYKLILKEKLNTRWKSICNNRIKLIKENSSYRKALKLYVEAEKSFGKSRFNETEGILNEIIKNYPDINLTAYALYFLGDINYYKLNNLTNSLRYYNRTIDKSGDTSLSRHSLYKIGEILMKQNRLEEAIKIYRQYLKQYKSSSLRDDVYYFIGECYFNLGRLKKAKNTFSLILGDYPDSKWTEVLYHKVQEINKQLKRKI